MIVHSFLYCFFLYEDNFNGLDANWAFGDG